jgi:NAD(P)-dependent dehydrogenase (short-subunit alcohol dehydrogenase family)
MAGLISASGNPYNVSKYGVVAFSEGLRAELATRGIGVSVLCPGFIRTRIISSQRNRPERFAADADTHTDTGAAPVGDWVQAIRDRVEGGLDPAYVGELVREAIEGDWPYIFTDTEFEPFVTARFQQIAAGFDRIRNRAPRP